jgi:hypothetical protein
MRGTSCSQHRPARRRAASPVGGFDRRQPIASSEVDQTWRSVRPALVPVRVRRVGVADPIRLDLLHDAAFQSAADRLAAGGSAADQRDGRAGLGRAGRRHPPPSGGAAHGGDRGGGGGGADSGGRPVPGGVSVRNPAGGDVRAGERPARQRRADVARLPAASLRQVPAVGHDRMGRLRAAGGMVGGGPRRAVDLPRLRAADGGTAGVLDPAAGGGAATAAAVRRSCLGVAPKRPSSAASA